MVAQLKKIPFKLWFFLFASVLLVSSIFSLPTLGANDESDEPYFVTEDYADLVVQYDRNYISLRGAIRKYHKNQNERFDDFAERLLSGETLSDGQPKYTTTPPKNTTDCDDLNVSTYCLALKSTNEYFAFVAALKGDDQTSHFFFDYDNVIDDIVKESAEYDASVAAQEASLAECEAEGDRDCSKYENWDMNLMREQQATRRLEKLIERQQLITSQLDLGEDVLDVALDTYNELTRYYPLHLQYQAMTEELEEYRDALARVRKQVDKYPDTFHDNTTTECT